MVVSITLGKYLNGTNLRKQEQDLPSAILYNDFTQGEQLKTRPVRQERKGRKRYVNTTDSAGNTLYGRTHL